MGTFAIVVLSVFGTIATLVLLLAFLVWLMPDKPVRFK